MPTGTPQINLVREAMIDSLVHRYQLMLAASYLSSKGLKETLFLATAIPVRATTQRLIVWVLFACNPMYNFPSGFFGTSAFGPFLRFFAIVAGYDLHVTL